MTKSKLLFSIYYVVLVGLFLYSYTQVDLSLTLSQLSIWQVIEKSFQHIGYFQRPLSTSVYIVILIMLFVTYVYILAAVNNGAIKRKIIWTTIITTAILLTFAYNAFSYDLFNYIFDAKIITHYFQNPYVHKALDFPQDPMLSFMHWTQRTYPYGPIWLLVTIPASFLGLQFFLPTFFLFKALASASYLGICWSIERILKKTDQKNALLGVSIFAFSPLVIIEGLISAHNDMVMVLFISLALVAFVDRKSVWSFLLLFLSVGVKFATVVLLPLWIIGIFFKKKGSLERFCLISFALLIIPVVLASVRTNFQPWYLLFLFPFIALMPKNAGILTGFSVFSFICLLQYIPFLYAGDWNPPIPFILTIILWVGIAFGAISMLGIGMMRSLVAKK